jgi:hypothetical protein
MAGKAAISSMTEACPRLYPDTGERHRPCIAKVTHAMGSLGIFLVRSDADEREMEDFLESAGRPEFVASELVDIRRNLACHFFVDPCGEVTWFGYVRPGRGRASQERERTQERGTRASARTRANRERAQDRDASEP